MKTRYVLGAVLFGSFAFATAAKAGDIPVRVDVHLGIPFPAPVVVHPHLYYPPVVYYGAPVYHHPYHHGHWRRHGDHHGKHHRPDNHWRHYGGGHHGYKSVAAPSHSYGGHGKREH